MRTGTCIATIGLAAILGGASCAEDPELVGTRSDGLVVVCAPDGDARFACDPQPSSGTDGSDTSGSGASGSDGDGCASWREGGPAIVLWPPNHKLHTITLADCARVRPGCGADRAAALGGGRVLAVTSDEPLDVLAGGDGSTPRGDLAIVGERAVSLRAERQGGGDGRVYRIALADPDGATDVCEVHVPHDRGPFGGAHDSGEAVRVEAN